MTHNTYVLTISLPTAEQRERHAWLARLSRLLNPRPVDYVPERGAKFLVIPNHKRK